ncbi:metallophosphoesterase [Ralstonia pseudosolanacearum]|nr:metallophosphoesterase [Ralstonia pseudosolanacearum]MDO3523600.1 metallophosphoesterase [Ralstonia pseudosolanacearum]MDO3549072.1 metallophosphoesterase [Ralstonia pseudosolanacearum]MDO3552073.1 metallophosphoesterase [Ralstonia pseudosolanacearum]MDO3567025.1 metallophosphoesterase [Ralstonia pseudosolanacearum]MDO3582435.1 metallophosphoesterase [Ralstonia pseudosolanacearum]
MPRLRILHLSDLHLAQKPLADQSIVLNALWTDLSEQRKTEGDFDLVFFTGDLVAKGQFSEVPPDLVEENFIAPLCKAAGLSRDRVFVAPGNHDKSMKDENFLTSQGLASLNSQDTIEKMCQDALSLSQILKPFDKFNNLCDKLSLRRAPESSFFFNSDININGLNIIVTVFNTAWRATGKSENYDYGRLLLGRRQVDEALSKKEENSLRLALMHHPFDWLSQFDKNDNSATILQNYAGIFSGHNHNTDINCLASPTGNTLISNAGCLYQSRDYFNGYAIITYDHDSSSWSIAAREYYERRRAFDAALRFAKNGIAEYSLATGKGKRLSFPTQDYINSVKDAVTPYLLSNAVSNVAPKELIDVFVEPPLSHLSEQKFNAGDSGAYLDLSSLLNQPVTPVFVGSKEGGKTTLLHYICLQYTLGHFGSSPLFGVYANLASIKPTRAELIKQLVGFSGSVISRSDFIELLSTGRVVLCLDDLDKASEALLKEIKSFCADYPSCKYIFSRSEDVTNIKKPDYIPNLIENHESVIYIHSFKRKHTRELAKKWFEADTSALPKVDMLLEALRRLNIPRTPFLISVLMWAHERNIEFEAVNQAEILDIFVDGILEKFTESKKRSAIDATIKRHFLGALAHHLFEKKKWSITELELEAFAIDHFQQRLLSASTSTLIEELFSKGLLFKSQGGIWFKYDCLRAYFLSCWMEEDADFLEKSLQPDWLPTLDQEIDYYTSRNRSSTLVLKRVMQALELRASAIPIEVDHAYFDDISTSGSPIVIENADKIASQFIGPPPASDEREATLDRIDENSNHIVIRQAAGNQEFLQTDAAKLVLTLRVASIVLRNSETISDGNLKTSSFNTIFELWAKILILSLSVVELLTDSDEVGFKELAGNAFKNISPYLVKALTANTISSAVKQSLATQKLDLVIEREINESRPTVVQFLACFLMIDLALPNYLNKVDSIIKSLSANRFSLELIFFKLSTRYLLQATNPTELTRLQQLLGDLHSKIANTKIANKGALKAKFLNDMEKRKHALARKSKI